MVSTVRIVACDTYERGDSAVPGGDGRGRTGTLRLAPSRCCTPVLVMYLSDPRPLSQLSVEWSDTQLWSDTTARELYEKI